jgi:hypothetical protein
MAPKKAKGGKKKTTLRTSEDSITNEELSTLDVQYDPDLVNGLIEALSKQIETKCTQIQKDSDFMVTSLRETFNLELIKLPKQIQQMSLSRFKEEFGESLEAVTRGAIAAISSSKNQIKNNSNNRNSIYASAQKQKTNSNNRVFQTPSSNLRNNYVAETPSSRLPKEGEIILSANGSPLGEFVSTVVKPKSKLNSIVPQTPGNVYIPLETGKIMDLESIDIESLTQEDKEDAYNKMQAMMSNMQLLMQKIQPLSKV